jgi:ring-1,2-phenylacetyl-CoA epoxidase subunit PaaD
VTSAELARAAQLVGAVADPELPEISIVDLGILRSVQETPGGRIIVTITPTYSGCPALEEISACIEAVLHADGFEDVEIETVLSPAWSTDMITDAGREKLRQQGIAPPPAHASRSLALHLLKVPCPNCGSSNTRLVSRFGSTACRSHRQCRACGEPFDHVRPI